MNNIFYLQDLMDEFGTLLTFEQIKKLSVEQLQDDAIDPYENIYRDVQEEDLYGDDTYDQEY